MIDRDLRITTLRTLSDCPDRFSCPGLHRLADRPGRIYQIGKKVTDPQERAAFATFVAADEELTWVPDELYPEV